MPNLCQDIAFLQGLFFASCLMQWREEAKVMEKAKSKAWQFDTILFFLI